MSHVQENIIRFFSKLNELRKEEKYTDVTLQCEAKNFKCHRLILIIASPYFEALFESNFKESNQDSIVLKEVSATTFEEILQFIYTGNIDVKATNVYDLLRMSDYYNLPGIENLCREFIGNSHLMTIRNVLPLFLYACDTNKKDFLSILSKLIAEHFNKCCKYPEFLEISFDSLQIILDHYLSLPSKNEESLLNSIIRWTCHKRIERLQYLDKFFGMIQLESISPAYYRLMTKLLIAERDPKADVFSTPADCITASELQQDPVLKIVNGLHVYVKYQEEKLVRIFSVNSANECINSGEISITNPDEKMRCAVSDNSYLYCLKYIGGIPDKKNQRFCLYTSIDQLIASALTLPPLLFADVSLCYLQNNIYAYNERTMYYDIIRTNSKSCTIFSDEEIKRGIFVYNCSSDNWFPVPQMKQIVCDACMTVCENTLYLIGGAETSYQFPSVAYAQAFDFRAGWRLLPASSNIYYRASCCSLDGKIYVCGGLLNMKGVERYDPIANKWETIQSMDNEAAYHQMIPFDNKLWVIGSYYFHDEDNCFIPSNDLSMNVYNVAVDQWSKSSILTEAAAALIVEPTSFIEGVVFGISR